MDGSDQSCSSPSPTRRSSVASKASPSAENHLSNQKMGSNLHSPNKSATKKFSSPTKCAVPKKILAERNGVSESIFSNTHSQKTQHFDSKVSSFDDDEQNVFVADSSSSQPYDPLTNYLSPRPKFLRYQPNRRRQILLSPRNAEGVGKYGLGTSLCLDPQATSEEASSSASSSQEEGSVKQEEEEIDESDEEIEEFEEEERGKWVLRGLLKSFLVFVVLALCTSYTCSMKSQTPSSLALQAVRDMKDGYERVQDRLLEAVKNLEGCSGPLLGDGFEVEEIVEDAAKDSNFKERESVVNLGFSHDHEAPIMSEDQVGDADKDSDFKEREGEPIMSEDQVLMKQVEEVANEAAVSRHNEEPKVAKNSNLEETESEEMDSCQDHETVPPMSEEETRDVAISHDNEEDKAAQNPDLEETQSEEILVFSYETLSPMSEDQALIKQVEEEMVVVPEILHLEETLSPMSEDQVLIKQVEEEMVVVPEILHLEDDVERIKERPLFSESSILMGSALGLCTIVASLVMGFVHHMKKKRATVTTNDHDSSNNSVALIEKKDEKEQQNDHLGSSKNESQISEVAAKDTPEEKLNHLSKAPPSIQMLSEFVVVEKKSMSRSKCSDSVPVKAMMPEMSEVSSNNSSECYSRRSMTAEKKMVKKSSSGGKENVVVEVATPVRRSSRIRSKSIISPCRRI